MSAPKRKDGVVSFADLQKEVDKTTGRSGTFRFQLDADTLIEIPPPTLDQVKDANKALSDEEQEGFFKAILDDQFDTVMKAFGSRDVRLFMAFQTMLVEFYGLGEALA